MSFVISDQFVSGVVQVISLFVPNLQFLFASANPFSTFDTSNQSKFLYLIETFSSAEDSVHGKRENVQFREEASTKPGMPQVGNRVRGFGQIDVSVDRSGATIENSINRRRDYSNSPICLIHFVVAVFISYSTNRDKLISMVPEGQMLPFVLSQFCQKVRHGDTTNISIKVSGCRPQPEWFTTFFEKTFFDQNYVTSPEGFACYLDFCSWCSVHSGNYINFIPFVAATSPSKFPRLYGGHQITFLAILTEFTDNSVLGQVQLLPYNAYAGGKTKDVNAFDALFSGSKLYTDPSFTTPLQFDRSIDRYNVSYNSTQNVALIVLFRATGVIVNSNNVEGEVSYDPLMSYPSPKKLKTFSKENVPSKKGKDVKKEKERENVNKEN